MIDAACRLFDAGTCRCHDYENRLKRVPDCVQLTPQKVRDHYERDSSERDRLSEALRGLGFDVTPSQANFIWARRADRPVKALYEGLKARKVLVRYMSYPGYGDGLRVSVGTDAEIDRLLTELATLLSA